MKKDIDVDKVADLLKKHYREEPTLWNKISKLLFGEPKDPFADLSSGELERLTRVTHDPSAEVETHVQFEPEMFMSGELNPDLHGEFASFYLENKYSFASANDFQFEPETNTLYHKGRPNSLKKFLKQVGTKESVINKILKNRPV